MPTNRKSTTVRRRGQAVAKLLEDPLNLLSLYAGSLHAAPWHGDEELFRRCHAAATEAGLFHAGHTLKIKNHSS